jgi:WD40 repeat protein
VASDSWKNPISLSLQAHVGNVSGVAFSPFSGDVVASVSNDGNLKIYNLKNVNILSCMFENCEKCFTGYIV